jgi:hypothetical protein
MSSGREVISMSAFASDWLNFILASLYEKGEWNAGPSGGIGVAPQSDRRAGEGREINYKEQTAPGPGLQ